MPPPQFYQPLESTFVPRMLANSLRSPTDSHPSSPSDAMCLYSGKSCLNPRAQKLSGGLHRFCSHHRMRHNSIQRAYQSRRQSRRDRLKDVSNINGLTDGQLQTSPTTVTSPPGQFPFPSPIEFSENHSSWSLPTDADMFGQFEASVTVAYSDDALEQHDSADNPSDKGSPALSQAMSSWCSSPNSSGQAQPARGPELPLCKQYYLSPQSNESMYGGATTSCDRSRIRRR